ncbi:Uncharacterised protein [Mycobacteroides abscessus]|nr:Uncharacterised protein [Mycobacteroides abscessus]
MITGWATRCGTTLQAEAWGRSPESCSRAVATCPARSSTSRAPAVAANRLARESCSTIGQASPARNAVSASK